MMLRWERIERYLDERIEAEVLMLKKNCDMNQTTMIRGRISVFEELLRLPDILTDEDQMGDEEDLPPETEINYGR